MHCSSGRALSRSTAVAERVAALGGTGQRVGPRPRAVRSSPVRSVRANASHNWSGHNVSDVPIGPVARKIAAGQTEAAGWALPAWRDCGCHRRMSALPLDPEESPRRAALGLPGEGPGTPVAHTQLAAKRGSAEDMPAWRRQRRGLHP